MSYSVAGSSQTRAYPRLGSDRPFANFQRVIAFESTAESRYHGLTLELNRRFSSGLQLRGAYTVGQVTDTVRDATAVVPGNAGDDLKYASNPLDFETDRTVGNNDQRHRFVGSGTYTTATRRAASTAWLAPWSTGGPSGILSAQSGQPYSARLDAVDLNNEGNTRSDLAPGTTRN